MTILFLGTEEDKPYLAVLKDVLPSSVGNTRVMLKRMDTLAELSMYCKQVGITHVITTQNQLIRKYVPSASTKVDSIANYAGSWLTSEQHPHFVTLIVSPLKQCVSLPTGKFILARYVSKITRPNRWIVPDKFSYSICDHPTQLAELVDIIRGATLCCLDIETRKDLSISSIAFTCLHKQHSGALTTSTYVIPLPRGLEEGEYEFRFHYIREACATATPKLGQNMKYDILHLMRFDCPVVNWRYDTAIAHHSWFSELKKDLSSLAAFYVREYVFWDVETFEGDSDALYHYNALDTWNTTWAWLAWVREAPAWAKNNYALQFRVQFPSIVMELTGIAVDEERMREIAAEQMVKVESARKALEVSLAVPGFNPGSSKQVQQLLTLLGVKKSGTDEKLLKKFAFSHPLNHWLVERILEYRKAVKLVSTYLNTDKLFRGVMLYSLTSYATRTGRLASGESAMWCGCMPTSKAMALTPEGWVAISERPPIIAQVSPSDGYSIEYVPASWNMYEYEGKLARYSGRCFTGEFTPEHKLLGWVRNKPVEQVVSHWASYKKQWSIPCNGNYSPEDKYPDITEEWLRICVMLSADGTDEGAYYGELRHKDRMRGAATLGNRWRVGVSKQAKRDRLHLITGQCSKDGNLSEHLYRYTIKGKGYCKVFPAWFLDLPAHKRVVILNELKYWDAHIRGDSFIYYTTVQSNAELIQTMCHITEYTASISINVDNNRGYGSGNNKPLYSVYISPKSFNAVEQFRWTSVHYAGEVGCPTVASGYWLVKYEGDIHMTGNSNIQNIPRGDSVKQCYVPFPGFKIGEVDKAQAESYCTGFISGDTVLIDAVTGPQDFHSFNGSKFFGVPYEAICQNLGNKSYKILDKALRQLAKPINHGCSYCMGAKVLVDTMGLELVFKAGKLLGLTSKWSAEKIAEYLIVKFSDTYPTLTRKYWSWVIRQVTVHKVLVGATGWTRYCFGRPDVNKHDANAYIAHAPQSLNAMQLNDSVFAVFTELWIPHHKVFKLCVQIHDSIVFQVAEGHEHLALEVKEIVERTSVTQVTDIFGITREMRIPADMSKLSSESWAECK